MLGGGFVGRLEVSLVPLGIVRARLRGFAGAVGGDVFALWRNAERFGKIFEFCVVESGL